MNSKNGFYNIEKGGRSYVRKNLDTYLIKILDKQNNSELFRVKIKAKNKKDCIILFKKDYKDIMIKYSEKGILSICKFDIY